jgi:ribosome maturation factor RimP
VENTRRRVEPGQNPVEPREALVERIVEELGFELVTFERAGGRRRPLWRLRVDRPESEPGRSSVTVDDCAAVSRAVRAVLEAEDGGEVEYILEVSSPGVERPLTRARDFERFAGWVVRVRGYGPLAGRGRQLEGVLLGMSTRDGDTIALEVGGETIEVPRGEIATAKLVYRWEDDL